MKTDYDKTLCVFYLSYSNAYHSPTLGPPPPLEYICMQLAWPQNSTIGSCYFHLGFCSRAQCHHAWVNICELCLCESYKYVLCFCWWHQHSQFIALKTDSFHFALLSWYMFFHSFVGVIIWYLDSCLLVTMCTLSVRNCRLWREVNLQSQDCRSYLVFAIVSFQTAVFCLVCHFVLFLWSFRHQTFVKTPVCIRCMTDVDTG